MRILSRAQFVGMHCAGLAMWELTEKHSKSMLPEKVILCPVCRVGGYGL